MNTAAPRWRRMAGVVLIGFLLSGLTILSLSERHRNPNSLLTGRWLVSLKGFPNAKRYVEFSPSGNVTAYKLDGITIDMVPGYRETWTVRGNIIECNAEYSAPTKSLLTTIKELTAPILSSERQIQPGPTRFSYTIEDASNLQLELLDSPTPHSVTLKRVPKTDK